jgi:p-aminobenzoyl-glutamate transporter AbgT
VPSSADFRRRGSLAGFLDLVERLGNKLPDPIILFVVGMVVVWCLSLGLSFVNFTELDPGQPQLNQRIKVKNMLSPDELANLLSSMVVTYVNFPPLGVVLVALLGVGVAEHAGFINAVLKSILDVTPRPLLTPFVIFVAIISHTAADAGFVLVIPVAGLMFHAAGRHPLAGIAAAFAGVSGGFSANLLPSGIDPLLAGLTAVGASVIDQSRGVNPLCNWYFTASSSFLIIAIGWMITDLLVEPRLRQTPIDEDAEVSTIENLSSSDRRAMWCGLLAMALGLAGLFLWALPANSALRDELGSLTSTRNSVSGIGFSARLIDEGLQLDQVDPGKAAAAAKLQRGDIIRRVNEKPVREFLRGRPIAGAFEPATPYLIEYSRDGETGHAIFISALISGAPLMGAIVPVVFLLFVLAGIVHGYVSGRFRTHRDVIKGMSKSMESMAYYLVLVFFVSMFIFVFTKSNIGLLLAVKGANLLQHQPASIIVVGVILISACVNLLIGSASAKWAMLSPIFVPMLMMLGISPEFTQAAYRVGDSTTNIITPLMPYFPLVVVYGQRYLKATGIGTLASIMLPYSVSLLMGWTLFLLIYWQLGIPLGIEGAYEYLNPQN